MSIQSLINQSSNRAEFGIEYLEVEETASTLPIRFEYYTVYFILSGSGTITTDKGASEYDVNNLFFFTPMEPFTVKVSTPTKVLKIEFSLDFLCIEQSVKDYVCNGVLFNNIYQSSQVILEEGLLYEKIQNIIESMRQELDIDDTGKRIILVSLMKIFLVTITRIKKGEIHDTNFTIPTYHWKVIEKFQDILEEHYKKQHRSGFYADRLHIHERTLYNILHKYYHRNPTEIILERILIEAKRDLYLTDKPIREIAIDLGFEDSTYFSKVFKKKLSVTPTEYRKCTGNLYQ